MTRKQSKDFAEEFKSLNNQIQALLIKYGAGPGSFYVNTIGIKDIEFEEEEQDEIERLINPLPEDEARIDVFYATNLTDVDELEEVLDNVYYAHSSEMAKERKERIMRKTPPEKGSTTASDWINLN